MTKKVKKMFMGGMGNMPPPNMGAGVGKTQMPMGHIPQGTPLNQPGIGGSQMRTGAPAGVGGSQVRTGSNMPGPQMGPVGSPSVRPPMSKLTEMGNSLSRGSNPPAGNLSALSKMMQSLPQAGAKMKKGGSVKASSASKRADGIAQRGKTRGKMV